MSRTRIIWAALAIIILLGAGLFYFSARHTATPAGTPSASPSATAGPSVSIYPPSPSPGSSALPWATAPYQISFTGSLPPTPQLTAIRTGAHPSDDYDRIAFDFKQTAPPGYSVQYTGQVARDGSGQAVSLSGSDFVQIVFTPAAAHTDSGQPSFSPQPITPVATNYAQLKSYVLNGDFEGRLSVALGLSSKNGFRVEQFQRSPGLWTVYVDVRR